MSQDYSITALAPQFEFVSETGREQCQLQDIWGRVPVKEMIEVLDSSWARELGWAPIQAGVHYEMVLEQSVIQSVTISGLGQVHVERRVVEGENVEVTAAIAARVRQRERLAAVADAGNLALNRVIARTIEQALPATASDLKLTITAQYIEQSQGSAVRDLVLQVSIPNR